MSGGLVFAFYNLLLPLLLVLALPGWIVKMMRRGGLGSGMLERLGIYRGESDYEPHGAVHIHAVSVGEAGIALKLIRLWQSREPEQRFVLAVGTATGHAVAREAGLPHVRVTYCPVDLPLSVRSYFSRFEPGQIVLIEAEVWPNLLRLAKKRGVPVHMVNARLSPRSERRYRKVQSLIRPVFAMLDGVAVQEKEDVQRFASALGIDAGKIHCTGSIKFDASLGSQPQKRAEFAAMLDAFGPQRPVILSASTHGEEDVMMAAAVRKAWPQALFVAVPRHAERREEVKKLLEKDGWEVVLRSAFRAPVHAQQACLVIDSTGELRDWTAHASLVLIGKSFLGHGGQNPAEAIVAGIPFACGPQMQNFRPLIDRLIEAGGCFSCRDEKGLVEAIGALRDVNGSVPGMTSRAREVLGQHNGATMRTWEWLRGLVL